jgi:TetR/AcrR family transcriptional regulator, tetracycline repressor protein
VWRREGDESRNLHLEHRSSDYMSYTVRVSNTVRVPARSTLTRAEVVAAGADLLDRTGIHGFSMRKLALQLDTGAATLYWHIRDKQDLLLAILDDTLQEVHSRSSGSWQERLEALLLDIRAALRRRPYLINVVWAAGWQLGPEPLRVGDELLGILADSGLSEGDVPNAYLTLLVFVYGFVQGEAAAPGNPDFEASTTSTAASTERDYPNLMRFAVGMEPERIDERFRYGVAQQIAGIKSRL